MHTKRLSNSELSAFCGQLALVLNAGLSPAEGLAIMLEDTAEPSERAVLAPILQALEETGDFPLALERSGLFPPYLLQMTRIAGETGTLDEVMTALSTHYEREASIARSIRSAVAYPAVMAGMMLAVILILLIKVMPIFHQVFRQLGTEMTGVSLTLLNLGTILGKYSLFFVLALALLVLLAAFFGRKGGFRKFGSFRGITEEQNICRFAGSMALALRSGLNPEQCLELVQDVTEDPDFSAGIRSCLGKLQDGQPLEQALRDAGLFSGLCSRMVLLGIRTGDTDKVLSEIADLSLEKLDGRIGRLLSAIEPTLVIALSLIVGLILMSVMFPLLGIMSGI